MNSSTDCIGLATEIKPSRDLNRLWVAATLMLLPREVGSSIAISTARGAMTVQCSNDSLQAYASPR